jgi:hypothetical protein
MENNVNIKLFHWNHKCADGCCDSYGVDVFVDGNKIGSVNDETEAIKLIVETLGFQCNVEVEHE